MKKNYRQVSTVLKVLFIMTIFALTSVAQDDLSTMLVVGVNQSVSTPDSINLVVRKSVNVSDEYFELLLNEALGEKRGEFIKAPANTVTYSWWDGKRFRVETNRVLEDGSTRPSKVVVSDGKSALRLSWDVPESLQPGVAEYISPEQALNHLTADRWEYYYQPRKSLKLSEALDMGYSIAVDSSGLESQLGEYTYGLILKNPYETIRLQVAPKAGFLPLSIVIESIAGVLLSESEVQEIGNYAGTFLPRKFIRKEYRDNEVVVSVESEIISADFEKKPDDTTFDLEVPEGFLVRTMDAQQ